VNIPIDLTNASSSTTPIIKSSSNQQQDSNFNNKNRTSGLHGNTNENTVRYFESNNQQRPSSSYAKQSVHDIPITNRPSTAQSYDRTINELRVNISSPSPYQQEKKVSLQIDEKIPQQRVTRLIVFKLKNKTF
jgi:hypothetical protein